MFMARHPRASYIVTPLLPLEVATPENESIRSTLSSFCKKVRASQAVLSRMQLTLHATRRTRRLVLAMSAWSVKTERAPSRHCRDARVYGRTPTAMPDNGSPPPPLRAYLRFCLSVLPALSMIGVDRRPQLRRSGGDDLR